MFRGKTQPLISKRIIINSLSIVGVATSGYFIYRYASKVIRQDPLESYKQVKEGELPDNVAIQSNDSTFRHFEDGKPQASCNVKVMQVAQNRQVYDFQGISNGKMVWKGATYQFAANKGNWNGFNKKMFMSGDLKLKGAKFNLKSAELTYDENRRVFTIPKSVVGTAYGGKLEVASFVYEMDKEAFKSGKGRWVGIPPEELTDGVPLQGKRTAWDVEFEDVSHSKDLSIYTDAKAKDGEIIIKAPKVEVNEKTDVLTATGRVRYFGTQANMIADKVVVYRKEKRAVFSGNVTMLVKPKDKESEPASEVELSPLPPVVPDSISATRPPAPDDDQTNKKEEEIRNAKNLRQYPLNITANSIEYWYKKGERRAKITGNPQGRQELPDNGWRYVWANNAFYDGEKEILNLMSAPGSQDVILKNSLNDRLFGVSGVLSTKDGDDSYSFKKGKANITTKDEDIPNNDKGKKDGGATADPGKGKGGGLSGPIGRQV